MKTPSAMTLLLGTTLLSLGCATPEERARPHKLEFVQVSRAGRGDFSYYQQVREPAPAVPGSTTPAR